MQVHNKDHEIIDDIERNQFERQYKDYIAALGPHLCDHSKIIFSDFLQLINTEFERLHKEFEKRV